MFPFTVNTHVTLTLLWLCLFLFRINQSGVYTVKIEHYINKHQCTLTDCVMLFYECTNATNSHQTTDYTDMAENIGTFLPYIKKKLHFLCIKLKLTEVYGIHHSLFHIEYNSNFAFDLQLHNKLKWPKISVPLT